MAFAEKLALRLKRIEVPLCVGLDPDWEKLPLIVKDQISPLAYFCKEIVDATADSALAFKPNIAFFERFGSKGIAQFEDVIRHIKIKHPDIPIVADIKRGDLANTSKEYARYYFQTLGVDSITISPYMGMDSLVPYLNMGGFLFILCLTSNPGSADFQRLPLEFSTPFFEHIATFFEGESSKYPNQLGIVVGGTHPEDLERIRGLAPSLHILIPGYGAQGGKLEEILPVSGKLSLINSSRSILYASSGENFAQKAGDSARKIRAEMLRILNS